MQKSTFVAIASLLMMATSVGCASVAQTQETQISSAESYDFQSLLDVSLEELKLKTEAHQAWGLNSYEQWNMDQTVGDLVFSNADGSQAIAPAQIIGTFNTNDNSWLWAWENPSIVDEMKVTALSLKEYGEQHGIEKLTTPKWTGTEDDAWAMTAIAAKLSGAQGAYRGPAGSTYVFMTFGKVTISKPLED